MHGLVNPNPFFHHCISVRYFVIKRTIFIVCFLQLDGGTVTLSMEELKRAYPNIRSLVGNSVYVKVSVLTSTESTQAGLRPEQQAKQQITVQPYVTFTSRQRNYLYISTGTNTVSVGDRLSLKLSISLAEQTQREFVKHITYLVLNKGKIITAEHMNVTGQVVTSVGLSVTPEMMPSFRFVAFYSIPWLALEEVVSDSIWIDVADSCVGGLKVGPVDGICRDYAPGKSFSFQIRGDPGAKVSLVAVDNAVYLLNKDRLTQRKIWDVVEHGDIGCTRGGGRDAKGVFSDAGLMQDCFRTALLLQYRCSKLQPDKVCTSMEQLSVLFGEFQPFLTRATSRVDNIVRAVNVFTCEGRYLLVLDSPVRLMSKTQSSSQESSCTVILVILMIFFFLVCICSHCLTPQKRCQHCMRLMHIIVLQPNILIFSACV
ncbi:complement C3-like [Amphiprion ocellaris]|uniref:complement C3-like n=1 Tax=Amphiprion ocellaris TaxID=80972 RepID=UPI00241115DC|nr:complement C3-like [Amphiprion ocellaris]